MLDTGHPQLRLPSSTGGPRCWWSSATSRRGRVAPCLAVPHDAAVRPFYDASYVPQTRYAKTADGVHIAYQVLGEGPFDIVFVNSNFSSNVEILWEWEELAASLRWLAARGRLVVFDRRGTGLSDSVSGDRLPTLEARMDDIGAVMDAVGIARAILYGLEDAAAQCFMFAATYPERTAAIITFGAASRGTWAPDAPWLWTEERWASWLGQIEGGWGTSKFTEDVATVVFPSRARDPRFLQTYGRAMRQSMRPADALASGRMHMERRMYATSFH